MSAECIACGRDLDYYGGCAFCHMQEERNAWIRLFNRLDAAVSKHRAAKSAGFADDIDDGLHAAHDRVLKDAATRESVAV
jgi:hypothetical protein